MTNIAKTVNEFLATNITELPTVYNDIFPFEASDCLISRHDPGTANEVSFIDGSAEGVLPLAYYMRASDAQTARATLTAIVDTLDGAQISNNGVVVNCEAITLPSFVQVDDAEQVIYTATINCAYTRKGE